MSDKRKFREWWIERGSYPGDRGRFSDPFYSTISDTPFEQSIHVIEHSAYLELKEEALKLEAALERVTRINIQATDPIHSNTVRLVREVANEALAPFKKWRGGE